MSDGLSICQLDSYARDSKSKVIGSKLNEDGTYTITLEDSVLYPEGGGQPSGYINIILYDTYYNI